MPFATASPNEDVDAVPPSKSGVVIPAGDRYEDRLLDEGSFLFEPE